MPRLQQPLRQHQGQLQCVGPVVAPAALFYLAVSNSINLLGLCNARRTDRRTRLTSTLNSDLQIGRILVLLELSSKFERRRVHSSERVVWNSGKGIWGMIFSHP